MNNKDNNEMYKLDGLSIIILLLGVIGLLILIHDISGVVDDVKKENAAAEARHYEYIQKGADEYNRNHPNGPTKYKSEKKYNTSTSKSSSTENKNTTTKSTVTKSTTRKSTTPTTSKKSTSTTSKKSTSTINKKSTSTKNTNSYSTKSKKRTYESKTVDPSDHDIETYYEDYKDEFEDEDDAWDDFEDNEEYWDDY